MLEPIGLVEFVFAFEHDKTEQPHFWPVHCYVQAEDVYSGACNS